MYFFIQAVKQVVRELEQKARGILAVIQAVHHNATTDSKEFYAV